MDTLTAAPEYPKIDTLYDRDEKTHKVIVGTLRRPEFALVDSWDVYEKIDGTNIRVIVGADGTVRFGGRTDNAQMPPRLLAALQEMFPADRLREVFNDPDKAVVDVVLYGEGYGAGIQNGGCYRGNPSFRLFDVRVGRWWLERDGVDDVAAKLGIKTAPYLGRFTTKEAAATVLNMSSVVAGEDGGLVGCIAEGIIARSPVTLTNRKGDRLMWKLKHKDF